MFINQFSSKLSLSILFGFLSAAPAAALNFSLDPASPSISGNLTPDDILNPGPSVFIEGFLLGLQDNFAQGDFDNLESISYGRDPIQGPLYFSVNRVAVGLPGSAVNSEAQPGSEDAAGDVYVALPPVGTNELIIDEEELGLVPGFFGDDIDGLELDTFPNPFVYFSIDSLSATNGFGAGTLADDILISTQDGTFDIYAEGTTNIGLEAEDDLDALVLWDVINPGVLDPGVDRALFSLSTFSQSTFTFTGNNYIPGVKFFLSPADILFTDFTGSFSLFASAATIGLLPDDEVDALDTLDTSTPNTIPEPSPIAGLLLVGGVLALSTKRRKIYFK